ncbi:MAG: hypothetical protein IK020_04130 [Clostridiales bacterium]|nr:hypothetical protein [Clostridiales bacterium]
MRLNLTIGKDRFIIEKRFSKKEVLFSDVVEITMDDHLFKMTTRDGKEINTKTGPFASHVPDAIFDVIRKHNIAFRDEEALASANRLVSNDDLEKEVEKTEAIVSPLATAIVREKLGEEYSIGLTTLYDDQFVSMYFCLQKDREPVTDLPDYVVYNHHSLAPGSFDLMTVAILCKWDATRNSGRYDLTIEMTERNACEKYVRETVGGFCEKYLNR